MLNCPQRIEGLGERPRRRAPPERSPALRRRIWIFVLAAAVAGVFAVVGGMG